MATLGKLRLRLEELGSQNRSDQLQEGKRRGPLGQRQGRGGRGGPAGPDGEVVWRPGPETLCAGGAGPAVESGGLSCSRPAPTPPPGEREPQGDQPGAPGRKAEQLVSPGDGSTHVPLAAPDTLLRGFCFGLFLIPPKGIHFIHFPV